MTELVTLRHGRIELALHRLTEGEVPGHRPLLMLHGLGERTPAAAPSWVDVWPGPVWGLDFTGHGRSTLPRGGGYTAEMLLGDADAALEHLGEATVVGRGLGGYISLLLAGARAARVHGAVICDGPGIAGGGIQPGSPFVVIPRFGLGETPDPFAMVELARDVRPPDYALNYVRFAFESAPVADPIVVSATVRPEWLAAVAAEPGVLELPRRDGLATYL
ncbi:MAG: alpha/beta hydrolase [Acidimicrobiales bacterium]